MGGKTSSQTGAFGGGPTAPQTAFPARPSERRLPSKRMRLVRAVPVNLSAAAEQAAPSPVRARTAAFHVRWSNLELRPLNELRSNQWSCPLSFGPGFGRRLFVPAGRRPAHELDARVPEQQTDAQSDRPSTSHWPTTTATMKTTGTQLRGTDANMAIRFAG